MLSDFDKIIPKKQPPTKALVCSKMGVGILTIAQIAIGAVYLNECPRQPYIPIYLIVAGSFSLSFGIVCFLPCTWKFEGGTTNKMTSFCMFWSFMTCFFVFAWFLAGNVWIYSIYQPNYNKNATNIDSYCNKTLYLFAFWTTTSIHILLGLALVIVFCLVSCLCLCGRDVLASNACENWFA